MGCVVAWPTLPQMLPCVQPKYVSVVMEERIRESLVIEG
jgi:hypothetical protein